MIMHFNPDLGYSDSAFQQCTVGTVVYWECRVCVFLQCTGSKMNMYWGCSNYLI